MPNFYAFYGASQADCPPVDPYYSALSSPRDLYDALLSLWCADTCAPRMRKDWSKDNPTLGQCSITAFLVQDIFGGEVYGIPLKEGGFHCFNKVGQCVFDLTSEQFGSLPLDYVHVTPQSRKEHFAKEEKRLRYEKLKASLQSLLRDKMN